MPDAAVLDASNTLVQSGVLGAFLVLVLAALVWIAYQWRSAERALLDEKDKRLADAITYAENTVKFAAQMEAVNVSAKASTAAINTVLEIVRDRGRA